MINTEERYVVRDTDGDVWRFDNGLVATTYDDPRRVHDWTPYLHSYDRAEVMKRHVEKSFDRVLCRIILFDEQFLAELMMDRMRA